MRQGWSRWVCLVVLAPLLASCDATPPASAPPGAGPAPAGSSANAWLDRYRAGAGGAALDAVRGFRLVGTMIDPNDTANRRLLVEAQHPARFRQEESPTSPNARPHRLIVGFDGEEGWWSGTVRLGGAGLSPDPEVRRRAIRAAARQNFVNVLAGVLPVWLADTSLTLTPLGEIPDGEDRGAWAIEIRDGTDAIGRLVVDPGTGLPRRLVVPYLRDIRPGGGEYVVRYSDFRPVEGVRLPFRITRSVLTASGGRADVQWAVSAYHLNPTFAADAFSITRR